MQSFMIILLTCSITMSVVALFYMMITPLLEKRYSAKGLYYTWAIIVIGLIIPFRPHFNNAIVKVDIPSKTVIQAIQTVSKTPAVTYTNVAELPLSLSSYSIWHIAFAVWLSGMIIFLVHCLIKHYRFLKMTARWSDNVMDEQTLTLFQSLKAEMGLSQNIDLQFCDSIGSPMMIGFINTIILLPKVTFEKNKLAFILKHELIHYKRRDLWYKCLTMIATAVHWFNPIVYLMSKNIDALCELSCDEEVIRDTDTDTRKQYSKTIISVVRRQSKLKTALSTNFYGGKKGMGKRIFSIMDTSKKKAGFVAVCGVLIITMGMVFVFAANSTANMPQANGNTTFFIEDSETYDKSTIYERYEQYGLTYDKTTDNLYFNGVLVRYFDDYYPIDENSYAGVDYFNENGTIDIRGVRDLLNIIHNADGSYDPSGKLLGVEPYSQTEFDARDIDKLKNPPQSLTVAHAENDISYTAPQAPQQNSNTTYAQATTDATDNWLNSQGKTIAQTLLEYKDYGIIFDENSVSGGLGNVYYQGRLVKSFADIAPDGGVLSFSSSDGGEITVHTVYDEKGKLTDVEVMED